MSNVFRAFSVSKLLYVLAETGNFVKCESETGRGVNTLYEKLVGTDTIDENWVPCNITASLKIMKGLYNSKRRDIKTAATKTDSIVTSILEEDNTFFGLFFSGKFTSIKSLFISVLSDSEVSDEHKKRITEIWINGCDKQNVLDNFDKAIEYRKEALENYSESQKKECCEFTKPFMKCLLDIAFSGLSYNEPIIIERSDEVLMEMAKKWFNNDSIRIWINNTLKQRILGNCKAVAPSDNTDNSVHITNNTYNIQKDKTIRKIFNPDYLLEEDIKKAKEGNGNEVNMIRAGIYYYYGISSSGKDERSAAEWFKKVSNIDGDYSPIADKFIARMYYAGSMPREEQSYEKSYEYHLKSAVGDIYSASQVGFMNSIGSGCTYDYKKTEEYFKKILPLLDNPRKDTVCRFYISHGEFKKAAEIYVDMADSYPEAAYQLGLLYKSGVLCDPFMPNYSKAASYFSLALNNGYIAGAYELGTLFFNPTGEFKKDFKMAEKYFHIAADEGNNPDAQYMLGYMYFYGHNKKDLKESLKYHKMAANQGSVLSSAHLALLYQIPDILDYDKAFKYAKYAADCGDTPSEFVLGTLYLCGKGCDPDIDKAYLSFKHAAENGAPEALLLLMQMEEIGL